VLGPASSADETVAIFDGTSGKAIKDSGLVLASGTYSPTITGVTNVTSASLQSGAVASFTRIGPTVFVALSLTINPTSGSTNTEVSITLPVARSGNFTASHQANGTGSRTGLSSISISGAVSANASSQLVIYDFAALSTATGTHKITFSYEL
jgi:hypothetical protein